MYNLHPTFTSLIHLVAFVHTGMKTYECLTHVAKAALTLSRSNAIPERGFAVNNAMLGKEKLSL